ncbi:MAG: hypothetical protein JSS66_05910 [Armatimonadetes bacterium]|nr:hypothetical protein [Armatimonadota bacterium]
MKIDWKLLADQKATLLELIAQGLVTPLQAEHLQGVVHYIDAEQDSAAARGVEGVVFRTGSFGYYDGDNQQVSSESHPPAGPNLKALWEALKNSEDDTGCDGVTVVDKEAWDKFVEALE